MRGTHRRTLAGQLLLWSIGLLGVTAVVAQIFMAAGHRQDVGSSAAAVDAKLPGYAIDD
jgi:hypothetical protein